MSRLLLSQYAHKQAAYKKLSVTLANLLLEIAETVGVQVILFENRVKTIDSFEEKINRENKKGKYRNIEDMTDICGMRIVLLSIEDCAKVIKGIRDNFEVDEENSVDKSTGLDDDRFGYTSTHLIVRLSNARSDLFEYKKITGLWAEIQIRTVLQHAWAVLDWELRYKSKTETPKDLRRKLYRLSASLEEADEVFSHLKRASDELKVQYRGKLSGGNLDLPLDKVSIEIFINESPIVEDVLKKCYAAGLVPSETAPTSDTPWEWLINALSYAEITNLEQFNESLSNVKDESIALLSKVHEVPDLVSLGIFSTLQFLVYSTIPKIRRMRGLKMLKISDGDEWDRVDEMKEKMLNEID